MIRAAGKHHNDIWIPGKELEMPQGMISPELVRKAFKQYVVPMEADVVSLADGSLSALVPPKGMPTGFLFVDIDDFLLDLSGSLQGIQHSDIKAPSGRLDNHDYGEGMFYKDEQTTTKHALISLVKQSKAGMQPAPHIYEIRNNFRSLRELGVYLCFLSVSTPGTELSTIENFLGQHFWNAGDGIVVIKGDYRKVDKGMAAARVIEFAEAYTGQQVKPGTPVMAMDDWPNHLKNIRSNIEGLERGLAVETIQYVFPSRQTPDPDSIHKSSVLACTAYALESFAKHARRSPDDILLPQIILL